MVFSHRGNFNNARPYQQGTPCTQCPTGYSCEINFVSNTGTIYLSIYIYIISFHISIRLSIYLSFVNPFTIILFFSEIEPILSTNYIAFIYNYLNNPRFCVCYFVFLSVRFFSHEEFVQLYF